MDARRWQGLGWWCWLRLGPGRRRARTQQQQQAAFEGGHTYMRSAWSLLERNLVICSGRFARLRLARRQPRARGLAVHVARTLNSTGKRPDPI